MSAAVNVIMFPCLRVCSSIPENDAIENQQRGVGWPTNFQPRMSRKAAFMPDQPAPGGFPGGVSYVTFEGDKPARRLAPIRNLRGRVFSKRLLIRIVEVIVGLLVLFTVISFWGRLMRQSGDAVGDVKLDLSQHADPGTVRVVKFVRASRKGALRKRLAANRPDDTLAALLDEAHVRVANHSITQ